MERQIDLALSEFNPTPTALVDPHTGRDREQITVDLEALFHHMHQLYSVTVPNSNPLLDFYLNFITDEQHLCLTGGGIGLDKETKTSESNKLGKAFCRWFLHEFCQMTYFVDVENLVSGRVRLTGGIRLKVVSQGDKPDYLCSQNSENLGLDRIFIAEAKGRYSAVSFTNKEFNKWREQVGRIEFVDSQDNALYAKGYIIATRFKREANPNTRSKIYAEDPRSSGNFPLRSEGTEIRRAIIAGHYASVMEKLNFPLFAEALRSNFLLGSDEVFRVGIWTCLVPPMRGVEFIGGYISPVNSYEIFPSPIDEVYSRINLSAPVPMFIGIHRKIFHAVKMIVTDGRVMADSLPSSPVEVRRSGNDFFPEGLSSLRDGTVVSPLDYFRFQEFSEE